jgi:hypothetical protein
MAAAGRIASSCICAQPAELSGGWPPSPVPESAHGGRTAAVHDSIPAGRATGRLDKEVTGNLLGVEAFLTISWSPSELNAVAPPTRRQSTTAMGCECGTSPPLGQQTVRLQLRRNHPFHGDGIALNAFENRRRSCLTVVAAEVARSRIHCRRRVQRGRRYPCRRCLPSEAETTHAVAVRQGHRHRHRRCLLEVEVHRESVVVS